MNESMFLCTSLSMQILLLSLFLCTIQKHRVVGWFINVVPGRIAPPLPHLAWFSILSTGLRRPRSMGGPDILQILCSSLQPCGHSQITLLYISCIFRKKTCENFSVLSHQICGVARCSVAFISCPDFDLAHALTIKPSSSPGGYSSWNLYWEREQCSIYIEKLSPLIVIWIYSVLTHTQRGKRHRTEKLHSYETYLVLQNKLKIPNLSPWLPPSLPTLFPLFHPVAVSVFLFTPLPILSAVAQGAVTEVSLVIIGLIQ